MYESKVDWILVSSLLVLVEFRRHYFGQFDHRSVIGNKHVLFTLFSHSRCCLGWLGGSR